MTKEERLEELEEYVWGITIDGPSGTHFKRAIVKLIELLEKDL